MTTLTTEAVNAPSFSEDEAINNLMSQWQDAETPSDDKGEGETSSTIEHEVSHEAPVVEGSDDDDAAALALLEDEERGEEDSSHTEQEGEGSPEAGDDHRVSITVDGETKHVTVKELKRLFGQEASLTRKSQEVAAARKAADSEGERYIVAMQRQINRAEQRYAPFAKIDWMVAQQRLNPAEFAALREEAREAHEDLSYLRQEADDVVGQLVQERQTQNTAAAKETIAILERDIPGWNREVYDQVRAHAVKIGMDANMVNGVVDPAAIKLMYDAMKYRQLKDKAAAKRTTPKAAPSRVVKPAVRTTGALGSKDKATEAQARLRKSGSTEDAVAALLAGWEDSND
ncbi:hypothetical protein [Novosphingobium clariflavum]|uniref:Scaffolding protein n=1 Tax=Novosphingobium clariflavum TaxID=2029884 RepID=A0ABV6SEH2_9SPHN|nr:hypothetical protein [Novosphingobium clariflavum]